MKFNIPQKAMARRGMTFIELTVVIIVLIGLLTVIIIGSRAWKRGSERAACVLNLRNVQMATRYYQNMYDYREGSKAEINDGTRDIAYHLLEKTLISRELFEQIKGVRPCPGGGHYVCHEPDVFPDYGQPYIRCSLSASEHHRPETGTVANW